MKNGAVRRTSETTLRVFCPHGKDDACPPCYKKGVVNAYYLGAAEQRTALIIAVTAWQKLGVDLLKHPSKYQRTVSPVPTPNLPEIKER